MNKTNDTRRDGTRSGDSSRDGTPSESSSLPHVAPTPNNPAWPPSPPSQQPLPQQPTPQQPLPQQPLPTAPQQPYPQQAAPQSAWPPNSFPQPSYPTPPCPQPNAGPYPQPSLPSPTYPAQAFPQPGYPPPQFPPTPYPVMPYPAAPYGTAPYSPAAYGPATYPAAGYGAPPTPGSFAPPPAPPNSAGADSDVAAPPVPLHLHVDSHHHHARRRPQLLVFTLTVILCTVMLTLSLVLVWHDTRSFDRSAPAVATAPSSLTDGPASGDEQNRAGDSSSHDAARRPSDLRDGRRAPYRDGGLGLDASRFLANADGTTGNAASGNPGYPSTSVAGGHAHHPFETDEPVAPHGTIDTLVLGQLKSLQIEPAHPCSHEVFLRRIFIDVLGTLPTEDEARRFLDDPDPEKRAKLIEQALERPEFADYWAMKWSDHLRVKAEFPIKLWPNAAQAYHRWIRTAIQDNMPYDQFALALLTSSGSNFRAPPVNFYRAVQNKEPKGLAAAVALTFLGERAESWPAERLDGMAVFFSQVGYKPTGEWKEEIVYFDRRKGKAKVDESLTATLPNGVTVPIRAGEDPRRAFADWLVKADNPWFARVAVNRIWCWLLGQGIVDPPDDVRRDNPPVNRELLDFLATELVRSKYDLKHVYRLILNSETYQLGCIPETKDEQAVRQFAFYPVRRLDAEVLIDAICQITGTSESYQSIIPEPYTFLPEGQRAVTLPDGSITSSFLEMFGRPPRDTGLESERTNRLTAAQALHLLNSNHLRNKLKQGTAVKERIRAAANPDAAAERLYVTILSRRPTDEERALAAGLCGSEEGALDLAWALINSDEFLFRH